MTYLRYAAIGALLIILQTSAVPILAIRGIEPDLILCFLVYFCIKKGALAGSIGSFLLGLSIDVYAPQQLGVSAFSACATGYLAGQLDERKIKIDDRYKILVLLFSSIFYQLVRSFLIFGLQKTFAQILLTYIIPVSLYTSLAGALLMFFPGVKR